MNLTTHQRVLLSGESLINDASGVVSFNFAIAAALTGTFSAADAARSFAVLFFGGIAAGVVLGWLAAVTMRALRNYGFENAAVRVLYEVLMPFVVFLVAERLGVSGILAVVATGLVMARTQPKLVSSIQAEYRLVSNSFWEVIVYVINGVVFTLLDMQLVTAFSPAVQGSFGILRLLRTMAFVTFLVVLVRFVWVSALELPHHDERGKRCTCHIGETLRQSLVTTIAGPKGAVTLSIIFTIPPTMPDGSPFPERSLIIFLTAGVILLTLAPADLTLPRLAPAEASEEDERAVYAASIKVLELTIAELEDRIASKKHPEFESATRDVISRYRIRLIRERLALEGSGPILWDLIRGHAGCAAETRGRDPGVRHGGHLHR